MVLLFSTEGIVCGLPKTCKRRTLDGKVLTEYRSQEDGFADSFARIYLLIQKNISTKNCTEQVIMPVQIPVTLKKDKQ